MFTCNIDLHIHTKFSFDCLDKVEAKLETAQKAGLDIIAIVDHNTIDGALRAEEMILSSLQRPRVIIGEEISTDRGEIIGLFLTRSVKSGNLFTVIDEIKQQGGIVYLPHPFKRSTIWKERSIINSLDLVEVFNARSTYEQNYKAFIFALQRGVLPACGSDAHSLGEIGRAKMVLTSSFKLDNCLNVQSFMNLLKMAERTEMIGTNKNHVFWEVKSQLLKMFKKRTITALNHIIRHISQSFVVKEKLNSLRIVKNKNSYELFDMKSYKDE